MNLVASSKERNVKVFNRDLVWKTECDGFTAGILVHGKNSIMRLTGDSEISSWIMLKKEEGKRGRVYRYDQNFNILITEEAGTYECLLREFEWPVRQYPVMNFKVTESDGPWKVSVVVPSRTSPLMEISGEKISGEELKSFAFNIQAELEKRGYAWQFMRIDIIFSLITDKPGRAKFAIDMPATSVLITQLPLARTIMQPRDGFTLGCILLDEKATPIHGSKDIRVSVADKTYPLKKVEKTGIYQTVVRNIECGEYIAKFSAVLDGGKTRYAETFLSVNNGEFAFYDPRVHHYKQCNRTLGFLAGDTWGGCINVPYVEKDGTELMINGMNEYLTVSPSKNLRLKPVIVTSLAPEELSRRFEYLSRCGYRGLKLANWPPTWLDAGGRVSPFGIEFFSFCLKESARLNMWAVVDIYHDWLGWRPGTISLDAYYEAGFLGGTEELDRLVDEARKHTKNPDVTQRVTHGHLSKDQWMEPANIAIFKKYYEQFLHLFKNDTRILAYSPGGEGDTTLGPRWANMLETFIRSIDQNHVVTIDQNGAIDYAVNAGNMVHGMHMDRNYLAIRYNQRLRKIMHTTAVGELPSDIGILVNLKCVMLEPGVIHGEGDCYAPNYIWNPSAGDTYESPNIFCEAYRLMVRDALSMSLLNGIAFYWNWQQIMVEDEYDIPTKVSDMIDWGRFRPSVPPVYIRIYRMTKECPMVLVQYEKAFAKTGIQLGYLFGNDPYPDGRACDYSLKGNPPYYVINLLEDGRIARYGDAESKWPPEKERIYTYNYDERHCKPLTAGGYLPDRVYNDFSYIEVPDGYCATYMINEEKDIFVAYVRNVTNYESHPKVERCSNLRAGRKEVSLSIKTKGLSKKSPLSVTVFDIDTKKMVMTDKYTDGASLDFGATRHDYCVVICTKNIK